MGLSRTQAIAGAVAVGLIGGAAALGLTRGGGSSSTSASGGPSGGAGGGNAASEDTPHVPHNNKAAIYNVFGLDPPNTKLINDLNDRLDREGYKTNLYVDSSEGGGGGQGGATLDNFVKMADEASVIIINAHGQDFAGNSQDCTIGKGGKGLTRCAIPDPAVPAPTTYVPTVERSTQVQPVIQVEWYPTWEDEQKAFDRYVQSGKYDKNWLYDPKLPNGEFYAPTLLPWRPGDWAPPDANGNQITSLGGARPWLGITQEGIEHFFKGKNVDFIDNLACHSMAVASAFDARSYFGHASTACTGFEVTDEITLFDRLLGKSGVEARPTDKAFALGGFKDPFFQLDPSSKPVVLSPAVKEVSPKEGAVVKPGETTAASITFDAAMKQDSAEGIVSVSGCSGKVENPKWNSETELKFDITIPKDQPEKSMTVTVHQDKALADPGTDDNHHLDGNQSPADKSGEAPNRDDYVYRLSCTNAAVLNVEVRYTGTMTADYTEGGFSYHVQFTWDEVQVGSFEFSDGRVQYLPLQPATLTASGMATSTGRPGAIQDACAYTAPAAPTSTITINAREDPGPSGRVRTTQVVAQMPNAAATQGGSQNSGLLTASGSCTSDSGKGAYPFLFSHPSGTADADGSFAKAGAPTLDGLDLDKLRGSPTVVELPFEYTQTSNTGGTDHVFGQATVTVSLR